MRQTFEVIVIGGGHAGTEAALAAARMGCATLLLTHNIETLGQMSCNPAIGGIGKGHLVKEIDAMGGAMACAADQAGIHFRILNASKGPAVRATRAQADRALYRQAIRSFIENQANLSVFQQAVDDVIIEGERIVGVVTQMGLKFYAPSVVLTSGTFLGGRIHVGESNYQGGRAGDPPANALAARLRELPLRVDRLKTGTPPRIDGRTLNYSVFTEQPGDIPTPRFSFLNAREEAKRPSQVSCYVTTTSTQTHDIIRASLHRSPMRTGAIEGVGPRYCPSIEDKVVRFATKASHQIFVEPEGLNTSEIYPNGISTSLPFDVQCEFVRTIRGFEQAHITRPGYAIEYDFFNPQDLNYSLETKCIDGLFFAGQINGTTGYEEAAAQGLLAGINAALKAKNQSAWWPARHQAYLGVLVDDLVTLGTQEPYRMFTSRAEHRLLLREDNADQRLTAKANELGLIDEGRWRRFNEKYECLQKESQRLRELCVQPNQVSSELANGPLNGELTQAYKAFDLLKRPRLNYRDLAAGVDNFAPIDDDEVIQLLETEAKYSGYILRQQSDIARQLAQEQLGLPANINYDEVRGLSNEARQKLASIRPLTLGQARRIPGMTPAAISVLLVHIKKRHAA